MSAYFLLIPLLIPLILGGIIRLVKPKNEKVYQILSLVGVSITAILCFIFFFFINEEKAILIPFNKAFYIGLKLDGLGKIFAGMVSILWPFSLLYSFAYMKDEEKRAKYNGYYTMTYGIVLGIAFSANLLTLFIFYELLTLITLPLIIHTNTNESRKAGRYYLYFSLTGSSLALMGLIILMKYAGTLDFINGGVTNLSTPIMLVAYLLTFIGFGTKAAIFPMCFWLPMASAAPTPTTALLHAVAVVKAGAFAIFRTTFFNFSIDALKGTWVQIVVMMIASFTILFGSIVALKEQHLKRRFAYSTISNLSYILLAISFMNKIGYIAAMAHMIIHSFAKICIFFSIGAIIKNSGAQYTYELNGLGKKMPLTFICYTLASLSLTGVPLFGGFISKWYIGVSALELGNVWGYIGLASVIISAILTAVYSLTLSFRAFVYKPTALNESIVESAKEPNTIYLTSIFTFAILSVVIGIASYPFINLISGLLIGGGI